MQISRLHTMLAAAAVFSTVQPASADTWNIDPKHSSANFSVRHMMVSNVRGDFSDLKGTVEYDSKDLKKAKVDATIEVSTINTRDANRDEHLRGDDFFDVKKFPTMKFVSKKVNVLKGGKFQLVGDLTMHGVTKQVTLDCEPMSSPITDKKGNLHTGTSASGKINRKEFGINYNSVLDGGGVAVGDEIAITLDIEMIRSAAVSSAK